MLACEGVPRDLGRDQGRALALEIRAAVSDSAPSRLAGLLVGESRTSRRWLRDVRRHFPHQAEWIEGLARAARVSPLALVAGMRRALGAELTGVALAVCSPSRVQVARSAVPGAVLRRMRPEGRFASLELASPLLPAPWAGVNEGGLVVAAIGGVDAPSSTCASSAVLLARDCLERFDALESALAWCLGRPAAGGSSLLLADAAGGVAAVEFGASDRRVLRPDAGSLLVAGSGCDVASLHKSLSGAARGDLDTLLEALLGEAAARSAIRLDPIARCLHPRRDAGPVSVR
jgi:hypothetical protein